MSKRLANILIKRHKDVAAAKERRQKLLDAKEWYTIRSLLGNQWANWFELIGAREIGKTYTVQNYVLGCFFNKNNILFEKPFYWMRLNDIAINNMKMNNAAKAFEPLLVEKYGLANKIKVSGDCIFYETKGKKLVLCYLYSLSTAYNNKGAALFNAKDFKGANIIIDEIAREKGQKRTFDVVYNLKMNIENIVRHERKNVKIFMMLNNTDECPEVLSMFGFIPLEFGRYKLKRKHCVIDYVPNSKRYKERRKNALANEIDEGTGNFTNKIARDLRLIYKKRLCKPSFVIKFSKDASDWFTVWDGKVVCQYHNEKTKTVIAMKRYIDETFLPEQVNAIIQRADVRDFNYRSILVQSLFYKNLEFIKK